MMKFLVAAPRSKPRPYLLSIHASHDVAYTLFFEIRTIMA
jgi:hypothetical protein